jgi:hypothetical protein
VVRANQRYKKMTFSKENRDYAARSCYLARSFVIRDGLLPEYFRGERCGKAADSEMGKWSWRVREVIVRAAGALLDGAEVNR